MNIIKTTSTADGVLKYGSNFKNYDYFVVKHLVASKDTRGDQGHFCSGFMTFHSLFVLEFENVLLAVDPSIGALPYWNWNDFSSSVFSSSMFGSAPGTDSLKEVVDGKFPSWPVQKMSTTIWSQYYAQYVDKTYLTFNGTTSSGYLRGMSTLTNPLMTRIGSSPTKGSSPTPSTCTSTSYFPWMNWYTCIESGTSPSFHSGPHGTVGGSNGDFMDPITSPNDPIFMLHHANLDRNKMTWMVNNADAASYFYGFSTVGNTLSTHLSHNGTMVHSSATVYKGIALSDYVTSSLGFTDLQLGISAHSSDSTLWTHADAVCQLQPTTSPYTYDALF